MILTTILSEIYGWELRKKGIENLNVISSRKLLHKSNNYMSKNTCVQNINCGRQKDPQTSIPAVPQMKALS